tara:strand:+ start:5007 stop:5573 length:567 start_codon:yes stop_codon:yes gene_type:complete
MNNQNLLICESKIFYEILSEQRDLLNFKIYNFTKKQFSELNLKDFGNYLILDLNKNLNNNDHIIVKNYPISLFNLIEKINIEFLKKNYNQQSNFHIGTYIVDINSRELLLDKDKLKLTEKEIDTLIYLSKNPQPNTIDKLQKNVWGYQSKLETHTVETHIHRLRKKIKEKFKDENLIISTKDGYQINK